MQLRQLDTISSAWKRSTVSVEGIDENTSVIKNQLLKSGLRENTENTYLSSKNALS